MKNIKKLGMSTVIALLLISITKQAKALDGDIYLLKDFSKAVYTQKETANFKNQRLIGLHSETYGYELAGKVYKFDDLTKVYNENKNDFEVARLKLMLSSFAVKDFVGKNTVTEADLAESILLIRDSDKVFTLLVKKTNSNLVYETQILSSLIVNGKLPLSVILINTGDTTYDTYKITLDSSIETSNVILELKDEYSYNNELYKMTLKFESLILGIK